jgi:hypothetical protein
MKKRISMTSMLLLMTVAAFANKTITSTKDGRSSLVATPERPHFYVLTCSNSSEYCYYMWSNGDLTVPGHGTWTEAIRIADNKILLNMSNWRPEEQ